MQLFVHELGKIAAFNFVYTLAPTNIKQSAPNIMYMTVRSHIKLIVKLDQIFQSYLPLNKEKMLFLTLFIP